MLHLHALIYTILFGGKPRPRSSTPQNNTITTTTTPDTAAPFVALKQPAVEALARILYFSRATASPPKTDAACQRWLRRQKRQIADLDETSLRRPRTLSLLGDVLFCRGGALARRRRPPQETLEAEGAAALCPSHKRLDPRVLMALMAQVVEEVTVWTESGKEKRWWDERNRRGAGEEEVEEEEEAAVEIWRKNMAKIAVLWMGRRRWEDEMGSSIEELEVPPCAKNRGCCAACKLAVVGGSVQFLIDLRTGLLARRELARGLQDDDDDEPPPPPLLRMVEAWIDVCYTRRRRRFMRTESDMMVNLLVRMQTSGGGSGGKVSGGSGGGEQRTKYTQFRGWPTPVMQVKVDELIRNAAAAADDDDDDDIEENEYGRGAATQWRRAKRMPDKEGYLQYLPTSPRAVPEPWTARGGGNATHNAKRDNADYRRSPPPPPPPPPPHVEPPWVTQDYDPPAATTSLAADPWHVDYDDWSIRQQSTWSFSSSSATLSAIYDAYHTAARSTTTVATSLCAPSPLSTQRGAVAAAEAPRSGAVSPPSPSVYSPVHNTSRSAAAAASAAAVATTPRWGASARSMRPPLPLQQRRLLSEITVPKRAKTAAAALRPPPLVIMRDPVQSTANKSDVWSDIAPVVLDNGQMDSAGYRGLDS
ncbi:hypothetical protein ARSEF1564_008697 [Beauveria bassiana]